MTDDAEAELDRGTSIAAGVLAALAFREWSIGCAESLTGGALTAVLTEMPGSSSAVHGGIVSYASEVKVDVLGVSQETVDECGVVSDECAREMAEGVRRVLGVDVGLATTGVAGPTRQEDKPVGRVHIAVVTPDGAHVEQLDLDGERDEIRYGTVRAVLTAALEAVAPPDV